MAHAILADERNAAEAIASRWDSVAAASLQAVGAR
jgi:hypothetical protein